MKIYLRNLLLGIAVLVLCGFGIVSAAVKPVRILIGQNATWIDKHAAEQLQEYVETMTGNRWQIITAGQMDESPQKAFIVAIGRARTNPVVKKLIEAEKIVLSKDFPGEDGFIVRSVSMGGRNYLVIGGSNDAGTLYGVYHYLENACGCGFFADGEYIPKRKEVPLLNVSYIEKPSFKWRAWNSDFGHWVIKKYQSKFWGRKEWYRQLDWMAKHKLNLTWYGMGAKFNMAATAVEVYELDPRQPQERYGGGWPEGWNWPDAYREELTRDIFSYARARGIKIAYLFNFGDVPREFYSKYPDRAKWIGPDIYDSVLIDPNDPLAYELTTKYIKRLIEKYGTDHIYFTTPYAEYAVTDDVKKALQVKTEAAQKLCELLAEIDTDWIWLSDAWDFRCQWGKTWTPQSVSAYLSSLPQERMILYSTAEDLWDKLYKKCNYYGKTTWGFGTLHSFAGDDEWHNGHEDLIKRVREAVREDSSNPCNGMFLVPELTNCDVLYFHLSAWLAWNPLEVEYESAIRQYCRLRYGRAGAEVMAQAWLTVLPALPKLGLSSSRRLYDCPEKTVDPDVTAKAIKGLKTGLEIALSQTDTLADNPLYIEDVFNFAKEYAGNMFNHQYTRAKKAAKQGDLKLFKRSGANALQCMTLLEGLLSTRPDLSLQKMIEEVMAVPGTNPYTPKMIRRGCINWDYSTNDVYEQFRFYYRPRIEAYLQSLQKQIETGQPDADLAERVKKIGEYWVDKGVDQSQLQPFSGTTLAAVEWLRQSIETMAVD